MGDKSASNSEIGFKEPRSVLVLDRSGTRQRWLDDIILDCGGEAHRIHELPAGDLPPCCGGVALLELEVEPARNSSLLAFMQRLRQNGFSILAFADGIDEWPVRRCCLALLAGASHLLDSASTGFEDQLRGLLSELLLADTEQDAEDQRVKDTMARLAVVGVSQSMVSVFRTILRISVLSDLPILLSGETGTGKELLAQATHALDPKRSKGPFIALNCAALTPTLAESELFGYRRGAFTGADRDRRGLIRAADGGALFLDEIGELDKPLQAKLLRVLQENCVLSVGDEREVPVSVRFIAATNRDLGELVKRGTFRADLFHRLNVVSVHIPALRERPEDIEPLTQSFLAKHAALRPEGALAVGRDFIEALTQAELPGNGRQLENLVRQALVRKKHGDRHLNLSDLPAEIWRELSRDERVSRTNEAAVPADPEKAAAMSDNNLSVREEYWERLLTAHEGSLSRCLATCERGILETALHRTHGNQSEAARLLGITPRSVYNKVSQHQLRSRD
jgi:transcriptional regulator with PAS, ATPase and Fis domain